MGLPVPAVPARSTGLAAGSAPDLRALPLFAALAVKGTYRAQVPFCQTHHSLAASFTTTDTSHLTKQRHMVLGVAVCAIVRISWQQSHLVPSHQRDLARRPRRTSPHLWAWLPANYQFLNHDLPDRLSSIQQQHQLCQRRLVAPSSTCGSILSFLDLSSTELKQLTH